MRIPNGTSVGPYHVISQLGAGGMGEVYRARDPRLSREVALKVIRRVLSVGADAQDETLDRLLREAILTTCRPSELAQLRHPFLPVKLDLIARGMCRDLRPGSLDLISVAKYIAIQFPEHGFPSDFARLVHERSEGNPLFMADLLRDLRRRQQVRQRDGRWMLADNLPAVERELPESIRSAVQRKVEALDDADRRLLGAASVQGIDFDSGMIAAALQLPEEEVEDRLDRLEREHALVRFVDELETRDRSLTLRYRFAHQLYHAAFYGGLRGTRRAALSRAIADRLVQRLGDEVSESAASLAAS